MVGAQASALNGTGTLLGSHIAKDKIVRHFELKGLRQSQNCFVTDKDH